MAKSKSQVAAPAQADATVPAVVVPSKSAPLAIAKATNFARGFLPSDATPAPAGVVKTAKGTNLSKVKVYGYDNGAQGGGVPKGAILAIVPGVTAPAGVTPNQWALLQTFAGKSVQAAYDGHVASRSVRRAYRAGAIRFMAA